MSRLSNPKIPVRKEPRPWTPMDVVFYGTMGLLTYALSPPWVTLLFRVCQSPSGVFYALTCFYAPVTVARQNIPLVDMFYSGYRDLLKPWLFGV